jgi:hypothetical protein
MKQYYVTLKSRLKGTEAITVRINAKTKEEAKSIAYDEYSCNYGVVIKKVEEIQ